MQRKLSQRATEEPEHRFDNLYSLLCNAGWLRVAHHKVNSNQGRETAGIDGMSMSNFNGDLDGNLEQLRQLLKAKVFEPQPVRRVYIPKANGKKRPLGIPGIRDRIVQEALRMILEPIWEADFSQRSYGFRPNRSTYDAISYISNRLTGNPGMAYQWVIEGDIASYFDTIPHRRLNKAIKKRVADRNVRDLLWKFLRAGVMHKEQFSETLSGTPQGGIISPLLANIYLHQLDRYMESKYLNLTSNQRRARREKGVGNCLYVRYADDFVVLCNGTKAEALAIKEELKELLSTMGLTLSEEKTKVTHITEGFIFLGYKIIRAVGETGKMVPKVLVPESATKKFRHKVREILAPNTLNESIKAKMMALNGLTRGWCNYYKCTSSPYVIFWKLNPEVFWGMAHWLGRKRQRSMPRIMQEYRRESTLGYKSMNLVMPTEIKARKRLVKAWHNPYTAKEAIIREQFLWYERLWVGNADRQEVADLREEMILLKGTICALQGPDCESNGKPLHPSEVEMDHIILRAKFKDVREADRMSNLQPVCSSCHRAKTKIDLKVLSRMR
jgi:RNA-directed DNA polymerase